MESVKDKSEKRRQYMLEGNLLAVIFTIAIPQVVTMLIDSVYSISDTYYVSQLGDAAISAVSVNDSLMMIIRAMSMGFGVGSSSFISRALGANRDEDASRAAVTTLFTAMALQCVVAALGQLYLLPLVNFLGATESVRPYSMQYARWILYSAPITAATTVIAQILRSEGNTLFSMIGMTSGCLVNIVIDPIFINTFGLGVAGAAMAKGICNSISLLILLWPFLTRKTVIHLKPSFFTPTKEIYAEILRMGVPTMMRSSLTSIATILINNTAASFGDAVMASISVANRSLRTVTHVVTGFSQGFQPVAGYCYGAKRYDRVMKAYRYTLTIGAIGGLVFGSGLAYYAPSVIGVFSADPAVKEVGLVLIRTQCLTMLPHVWTMISSGFFQALGKATKAAVMGLSRQLIALIPSVLILPRLFGAMGLACAQATSDTISFILAMILVIPTLKELGAIQRGEIEAPEVTTRRGREAADA